MHICVLKGNFGLLGQRSAYFFCKWSDDKLCSHPVSGNYSRESSHMQNINEQVWLRCNKLWTLKLEFNMVCTCHEILIFFQAFNKCKNHSVWEPQEIRQHRLQFADSCSKCSCSDISNARAHLLCPPTLGSCVWLAVGVCENLDTQNDSCFILRQGEEHLLRPFGNTRKSVMQNVVLGTPSYKIIM